MRSASFLLAHTFTFVTRLRSANRVTPVEQMMAALGHCEDPACLQKSPAPSHELVRLFRCSIHCDRNLCLFHLNSHNVYYEQQKHENDAVTHELETALTIYQKLFEEHITTYHELVRQATAIICHSTSTLVPTERIRNVLANVQSAISILDKELVIKCEPALALPAEEEKKEVIALEDDRASVTSPAEKENVPVAEPEKPRQNFIIRVPRMDSVDTESSIAVAHSEKDASPSSPAKHTPKRGTDSRRARGKSTKRLQK